MPHPKSKAPVALVHDDQDAAFIGRPPDVGDDVAAFVRRERERAQLRDAELHGALAERARTAAGPGEVAVLVGASDAARAAGARGRADAPAAALTCVYGLARAAGEVACEPASCSATSGDRAACIEADEANRSVVSPGVGVSVLGLSPRRREDLNRPGNVLLDGISRTPAGSCAPHGRTESSSREVATRSTGTAPLPPTTCGEGELLAAMARNIAERCQLWQDAQLRRWAVDVAGELLALAAEVPADVFGIGEGVARG